MLARMISKTWLTKSDDEDVIGDVMEHSGKPLFIDRDGERFRYVLDYMRDGPTISLPVTVSKDGFLMDLDFFGFENVNPTLVSALTSYAVYMDTVEKMEKFDSKGVMEQNCSELAHYCFLRFKFSGSLSVYMKEHNAKDFHRPNHIKYNDKVKFDGLKKFVEQRIYRGHTSDTTCLNKYLKEYDLQYKKN